MNQPNHHILCIEDDYDTCDLIAHAFAQADYNVTTCFDSQYLELMRREEFAAVILDNYFMGLSGVAICRRIREIDANIPIIFFSGETRREKIKEALDAGGSCFLIKPFDFQTLATTVTQLVNHNQPAASRTNH